MFDRIKAFYNKDDFEYHRGLVDPYKFHTIFYYIIKGFQVIDDEPSPYWTYLVQALLMLCTLIGLLMSVFSTYHGIDLHDLPFLTEAGMYFIIFFTKLMILSCTKLNLPQYHAFLQTMRHDFKYICTDGAKYRKRFFNHQLVTWKVSILSLVLISGIGFGTVCLSTASLIYFLATHNPNDMEEKRPLLFPLWSPAFDFGDSPYYEIAFVTFNIVPCAYAYGYIFKIVIEIIWIRQIIVKADLVIWSIQNLMVDFKPSRNETEEHDNAELLRRRFRDIVIKHASMYDLMENYAKVYKKLLLFTQELYAPVVCFTAYSAAEKLDVGELNIVLILLCLSAMVLIFIPSYLCTMLALKVTSISDACWDTPFWAAGPSIRAYMLLIMQRSTRPLPTHTIGFQDTSMETFSQKTTTAYSFFNMLRQAK